MVVENEAKVKMNHMVPMEHELKGMQPYFFYFANEKIS